MAIQINTASVSTAAEQIDSLNKKMRDEMGKLDSAIRVLQQNWEGSASNTCVNKYEHIKGNFSDARFFVVNGVVSFMKNQVGEGYEVTETSVSNAASAFK